MRRHAVPISFVFAIIVPTHFALAQKRGPADVEIWRDLKARLQANDGDSFFESSVKDAVVPSGSLHSFQGTVVSSQPAMPVVSVNYPYSLPLRFGKISLDGLPLHRVTINDHGVTTETLGVRLERFLVTAGWFPHSSVDRPHYAVEIDGVQTLTTLEMDGLDSFDKQAWLVPTGSPEASLVVVQADATLIQKVEGIQRIRVLERP
jgi:hypothetical protein